jgi:hypothetical protein
MRKLLQNWEKNLGAAQKSKNARQVLSQPKGPDTTETHQEIIRHQETFLYRQTVDKPLREGGSEDLFSKISLYCGS